MASATVPVRAVPPVGAPATHRRPGGAVALAVAGLCFLAYPALRPYSDESTLAGAAAMSSTAWVVAHLLGVAAFLLTSHGLTSDVRPGRAGRVAAGAAWLGTALVLPYYGAETFGLRVVAQRALDTGDASLLGLAEDFRMGAVPVTMFGTGLLLLAAAGVALVVATWPARGTRRLAGALAGTGLALYLPQFFAPPVVRVAHGVLLAVGLVLLAVTSWRTRPAESIQG